MLSERLMNEIPNLTMLQINTDGLTVRLPKKYAKRYVKICQEWEAVTKLRLEYVRYTKMIISDVNNYIAVSKDGKIKRKGTFKLNSEMRKDGEWHKSFSQGVVPIAVSEYFLNNVPVEKTVRECKDVFEFTKMANSVGKWWTETFEETENKEFINIVPQQKNNRYILTNSGVRFRKCVYKPDKETGEDKLFTTEYEANKLVTILNKYDDQTVEELDIDHQYYIDECYKIIHLIDGTLERQEQERKQLREENKLKREEENFIKFCVNKRPTIKQWESYSREWLIDKYIKSGKYQNFQLMLPEEKKTGLDKWTFI